MLAKTKISLSIPDSVKPGQYFSVKLKQNKFNERSEYNQPSKVFVVSDIEGNFRSFVNLLIKNRVIDRSLKWRFEDGHLVIVGDCFDRGEDVAECLWLIYSLEESALTEGGYVHFILGNHEIMNMNGDWRYVHPKYAPKTANTKHPSAALYDANSELWRWLCTKNIVEKIGSTLFVHGGIAYELLHFKLSVYEINDLARPYYARAKEKFVDPVLNTLFNSDYSPFWYRGYYQKEISEEQIDETLRHFEVNTIVTGHTIVEKVTPFFNGKIINVNTDHAMGKSEALLIRKGKFYRIEKDGKREKMK
jgi:hypothetical protein